MATRTSASCTRPWAEEDEAKYHQVDGDRNPCLMYKNCHLVKNKDTGDGDSQTKAEDESEGTGGCGDSDSSEGTGDSGGDSQTKAEDESERCDGGNNSQTKDEDESEGTSDFGNGDRSEGTGDGGGDSQTKAEDESEGKTKKGTKYQDKTEEYEAGNEPNDIPQDETKGGEYQAKIKKGTKYQDKTETEGIGDKNLGFLYQAKTEEYEAKYQAETGDDLGDCHRGKTRATGGDFLQYQAETKEYDTSTRPRRGPGPT